MATAPGEVDTGRQVLEANCAMCDGDDAGGMTGMHPSLRGAVERLSGEAWRWPSATGGTQPAHAGLCRTLDQDEIEDVIAFIESLPPGPRNFGPETVMVGC
ncbi:MAG TPA: cytochrome c [Nitriliruptorales bacterium]|nr:cytochrome c [Nitriliruptorales bacterium]